MQIKSEHAVSLGITAGFMFLTGAGFGLGVFSPGEALLAALVSIMLGFLPVATLFQEIRELRKSEAENPSA